MKKTDKTYQVYVANPHYTAVLARGSKAEMTELFNQAKDDPEYECVELAKWSVRYHCWYAIKKHTTYGAEK